MLRERQFTAGTWPQFRRQDPWKQSKFCDGNTSSNTEVTLSRRIRLWVQPRRKAGGNPNRLGHGSVSQTKTRYATRSETSVANDRTLTACLMYSRALITLPPLREHWSLAHILGSCILQTRNHQESVTSFKQKKPHAKQGESGHIAKKLPQKDNFPNYMG